MLKYFFVFLTLFTQVFSFEGLNYKVIEDQALIPSLNPEFKERKIAKIELENGLQAYIISDPGTQQSAAALSVQSGSWQNPDEHPGLAHFLEHMLFLGTKKYPVESEYDRYLSSHGGTANAFTTNDFTSYLFSVNNDGFIEALDRFSNFFVEPLFNPSGVNRELNAIDQEFAMTLNSEGHRQLQVFKELGNPNHPYHRFSAGNSQSLSSASQEILRNWFENHYSANLMKLFIYSNLPIEELKEIVIRDFSPIPNKNFPKSSFPGPVTRQDLKGHLVYIKPNQETRTLNLTWELPREFAKMRESKPEEIVCYILGHQGPKSLLGELKNENLAEEIVCSGSLISNDTMFFELEVTLTAKGLTQIDTVISRVFQGIKNLQQKEIPEYIFDDVHNLVLLNYQYQPREDTFTMAMKHALLMPREEMSTYPEVTYTLKKRDIAALKALVNYLTPQNALFSISASDDLDIQYDHTEKVFGVPYAIVPLSKEQLTRYSQAEAVPEIDFPLPNPFIPKNLNLVSQSFLAQDKFLEAPTPEKIIDTSSILGYYAPDFIYQAPKTYVHFTIKSPSINNGSPQSVAMTELYIEMFEDTIDSLSYDAEMADVDFTIEKTVEGLEITVYGFNESVLKFLEIVGPKLVIKDISPEKFDIYKNVISRKYNNLSKEHPLLLATDTMRGIVYENYAVNARKIEALNNIDLKKFKQFLTKLFAKTYTEVLVTGNVTKDQALAALNNFQKDLGSKPYPIDEHIPIKVIELPNDKGPFYVKIESKARGNASLLAIEGAVFSIQARNMQQILVQALKSAFFAELRTKQQTGYVVHTAGEDLERHLFTTLAIQSNSHEPNELLYRFELFLENFLRNLTTTEIPEERFNLLKAWLYTELNTPPKNLKYMGQRLASLAFKYKNFNWIQERIKELEKLTYTEFVTFVNDLLGRSNKRRLGVFVEGQMVEDTKFRYAPYTISKLKATSRDSFACGCASHSKERLTCVK